MNGFEQAVGENKVIRYRRAIPDGKKLTILMGCITGMLFFYLSGGDDITLEYTLHDSESVYWHLLFTRLKQVLILTICSFSYFDKMTEYSVLYTLSFEFIPILFTFVYNYKIWGIMICVATVLPHGIFYLLLILIIFDNRKNDIKPSIYKEKTDFLWKIIICVILFLLGFLCESCIGLEVVKNILTT